MNTFYLARTDGLTAVVGAGPDDRRRTADASAAFERRAAVAAARSRRGRPAWLRTALARVPLRPGYRGRRWQPEVAPPGC